MLDVPWAACTPIGQGCSAAVRAVWLLGRRPSTTYLCRYLYTYLPPPPPLSSRGKCCLSLAGQGRRPRCIWLTGACGPEWPGRGKAVSSHAPEADGLGVGCHLLFRLLSVWCVICLPRVTAAGGLLVCSWCLTLSGRSVQSVRTVCRMYAHIWRGNVVRVSARGSDSSLRW